MADVILRTVLVWLGLTLLFRMAGRRTLGELSAVDLIPLLIVGDIVAPALIGDDNSLAAAFVVVGTLVLLGVGYSFAYRVAPRLVRAVEGTPTVLVREGEPVEAMLRRSRVELDDVLAAARQDGIADLSGVRYAILEVDGRISVIPREGDGGGGMAGGGERGGREGQERQGLGG